jgi:transcriptional regulator
MKKQDHTKAFYQNPNALVVFSGAHSYVSASWYTNKQVASTWNYQTVQASGSLQFQDEVFLEQVLSRLTEHFEKAGSTSLVQNMDPQYVRQMMQAIVAFEVEVHSIRHVFKLSQNRDKLSKENIISELNKIDANAREIAQAMEEKFNKNA